MSRAEEIMETINRLSDEEHRELADRLREQDEARWDEQMDADSAAGKLNFLVQEAKAEKKTGLLRPWPNL